MLFGILFVLMMGVQSVLKKKEEKEEFVLVKHAYHDSKHNCNDCEEHKVVKCPGGNDCEGDVHRDLHECSWSVKHEHFMFGEQTYANEVDTTECKGCDFCNVKMSEDDINWYCPNLCYQTNKKCDGHHMLGAVCLVDDVPFQGTEEECIRKLKELEDQCYYVVITLKQFEFLLTKV